MSHPHIVNLWATFQDNSALYMVMEFVQGGEVFSHLRRLGRFSPDIARVLGAEVCLALAFLHAKDIVYRDLKPENLLLDHRGHIKITDFGFAKVVKDKTWTVSDGKLLLCFFAPPRSSVRSCAARPSTCAPRSSSPRVTRTRPTGGRLAYCSLSSWLGTLLFSTTTPFASTRRSSRARYASAMCAAASSPHSSQLPFPSFFEAHAKDIIKRLCQPDRTKRLGCIKTGVAGIQKHKFFKGVDWKTVGTGLGPITIELGSAGDTSNFDKYPAAEEEPVAGVDPFKAIFRDF